MVLVLANAGLPMIFWQLPAMTIALIPIIAVESAVAGKLSRQPVRQTIPAVGLANVASTFIGIPLAWGVMLILNIVATGTKAHGFDSPLACFQTVVLQSSWLVPYEDQLHWLIPAATLVLLLPYFLVSVFVEQLVLRKIWNDGDASVTTKVAWCMNSTSYSLLAALTGVWLWAGLAG